MERRHPEVTLRDLARHTTRILERVAAGETLTITVRRRPVAMLTPVRGCVHTPGFQTEEREKNHLRALVSAGKIAWSGGKPRGCANAPRIRGASVAEAVIKDRR